MRRRITGTLLAATLLACGGGAAPATDRVSEAHVTSRFQSWVKAWNLHNPDSLAPFYIQQGYVSAVWPTGVRTLGWTEEARYQRTFLPRVKLANLVAQSPRVVLVRKNLALVTFPFALDLQAGDARHIGPGQGTMLWQEEGGAWRIYVAHLSYAKVAEELNEPTNEQRRR